MAEAAETTAAAEDVPEDVTMHAIEAVLLVQQRHPCTPPEEASPSDLALTCDADSIGD